VARAAAPAGMDDVTIREKLEAELKAQEGAPAATVSVVVRDGIVELWGVIIDERQREAIKVAAENIPGVNAVKDHMVWVEPMSGMAIESPEDARPH
jgi:osmotically-inducible protein OsmY